MSQASSIAVGEQDSVAQLEQALHSELDRSYYPSPRDWRDEVGYSLFLDRFNHARFRAIVGDPAGGETRHGGNLPGVTARLDYLSELGVTFLQLSPVNVVHPDCYHHYAPLHLARVDPRLGTLDDLVELVDEAHRRGIRVIFDLLVNHMARVFDYEDGDHFRAAPASIGQWKSPFAPIEFTDEGRFSRRGVIEDWKHPEQAARGDFPPGLRRIASEDPETASLLVVVAKWWLRVSDIDGVRIDAIRHLDRAFVRLLTRELKEYAARLGKDNFFVLGEFSATDDAPIAECLELGIDSVYNYPEYRRQSWALHEQAPTVVLEKSLLQARAAWGERAHDRAVRFIDNHDVYRFLRDGEPVGRLDVALAFLTLSTGMPMLYYGTEQGFRQPTGRLERECSADRAAPRNREDMFEDGAFTSSSSAGDRFDVASPVFLWTRRLLTLRQELRPLRHGRQVPRFADPEGPGLYAFSRETEDEAVLVVLNTSGEVKHGLLPVGDILASQPSLVDVLSSEPRTVDVSGGGVKVELAPYRVRVFTAPHEDRTL